MNVINMNKDKTIKKLKEREEKLQTNYKKAIQILGNVKTRETSRNKGILKEEFEEEYNAVKKYVESLEKEEGEKNEFL